MKILFVCRGNVGRSQMAEEIFKQKVHGAHTAFSAGTWVFDKDGVSMHGKKLHEFEAVREVLASLQELGLNANENQRDQLSEEMMNEADIVVVMAEEHTIPDYVKQSPKVRYWEVVDPKGMNQEDTNKIRDQIARHVDELILELPNA